MTPTELLNIAKNINPEKLERDPQAALEDAYVVYEAFRLFEKERLSHSQALNAKEVAKVLAGKGRDEVAVDRLRRYIKDHPDETRTGIAKRIGVSSSSMYHWLDGTNRPSTKTVLRLEDFLE